jgi:aldehyde dehydrogenase (NAD+)
METPTEGIQTTYKTTEKPNDFLELFMKQKANRWDMAKTTASERIKKLKRLKKAIWDQQDEIGLMIQKDFGKNPSEVDLTEIYPTLSEIDHTIKHLKKWMKPKKVKTPIALFGNSSRVHYEARGVVLILSPWNYPFNLLINPLITALAAGNCAIVKPSSKVPHISSFLKKLLSDVFEENEVAVIEGSSAVSDELLKLPFDHIFFTGSPRIGKTVMAKAAKNLTTVTLELGGKSPVVVDESANIRKAAERIMWGKFINAGQTCVAPDYLLIHESKKDEFIKESIKVLEKRYGDDPTKRKSSGSFCRLVSKAHLEGLEKILDKTIDQGAKIKFGGEVDPAQRYLAPTIISEVGPNMEIMKEEIFGPILPIVTFRNIDEAINIIRSHEKPLALYIFSKNKKVSRKVINQTTAGGSCINGTIIHLANPDLPFGGVGQSGMGSYHGHFGFRALSHERAVLTQSSLLDTLKFFYPPYSNWVKKLIKLSMKYL